MGATGGGGGGALGLFACGGGGGGGAAGLIGRFGATGGVASVSALDSSSFFGVMMRWVRDKNEGMPGRGAGGVGRIGGSWPSVGLAGAPAPRDD